MSVMSKSAPLALFILPVLSATWTQITAEVNFMRKLIRSVLFSAFCPAFFFRKHPFARPLVEIMKSGAVFLLSDFCSVREGLE